MDSFSYHDIFATKGIEYLIIITFLVLLIPFWIMLNKQKGIGYKIQKALTFITIGILKIPQGLFYSKNHTWMYMERSGYANIGLDDLLLHIVGEVRFNHHKKSGETIRKGELLTEVDQNGKLLRILSPVSGKIMNLNTKINDNPGLLNEDPYGRGWICEIKPNNWIAETKTCYFAEEATNWSSNELERIKDFLAVSMKNNASESSMVVLQDGGELRDHSLSAFSVETWNDFEKEFLVL